MSRYLVSVLAALVGFLAIVIADTAFALDYPKYEGIYLRFEDDSFVQLKQHGQRTFRGPGVNIVRGISVVPYDNVKFYLPVEYEKFPNYEMSRIQSVVVIARHQAGIRLNTMVSLKEYYGDEAQRVGPFPSAIGRKGNKIVPAATLPHYPTLSDCGWGEEQLRVRNVDVFTREFILPSSPPPSLVGVYRQCGEPDGEKIPILGWAVIFSGGYFPFFTNRPDETLYPPYGSSSDTSVPDSKTSSDEEEYADHTEPDPHGESRDQPDAEETREDSARTTDANEDPELDAAADEFAALYPDAMQRFVDDFGEHVARKFAAEMLATISEFGLRDVFRAFLDARMDAFDGFIRQAELQTVGLEVGVEMLSEEVARFVVERYADMSGANVDTDLILSLASPTAQLTVAGMTHSVPGGLAIQAGISTFTYTQGLALASYREDEQFEILSRSLVAADRFRRAADDMEEEGRGEAARALREFADNVIKDAAERAEDVFKGPDGPVVGTLLRGMDKVIILVRQGEEQAAHDLFWWLNEIAEDNAPGFFSLSTNNFYERYFMVGHQRKGGTVRAFLQLDAILQDVLKEEG